MATSFDPEAQLEREGLSYLYPLRRPILIPRTTAPERVSSRPPTPVSSSGNEERKGTQPPFKVVAFR
jgi:hypothetical protein